MHEVSVPDRRTYIQHTVILALPATSQLCQRHDSTRRNLELNRELVGRLLFPVSPLHQVERCVYRPKRLESHEQLDHVDLKQYVT